jgi:hypothetical protein
MKKLIDISLILILIISSELYAENKDDYSKLLSDNSGIPVKNLQIINFNDYTLEEYRNLYNRKNVSHILKLEQQAYNAGTIKTSLSKDMNNDGEQEIVLACINKKRNKGYVVIFEKDNKNYKFMKIFEFPFYKIFFYNGKENYINGVYIGHEIETSLDKKIIWKDNKYILQVLE